MFKSSAALTIALGIAAGAGNAEIAVIGTMQWYGPDATPKNLIYDDNGRRGPGGAISGGLIWLDNSYYSNNVEADPSLGTGANARQFAGVMTQHTGEAVITLRPGFRIDSWDSGWRLPHSGTNPLNNPPDSEMLHLVVDELGNPPGATFSSSSVFANLMTQLPTEPGGGYFAYWLEQDAPSQRGTEINYNTRTGKQQTTPELFHGGYVVFVRSATVSYDPTAPGAASRPPVANPVEGNAASAGDSADLDAYRYLFDYAPAAGMASADIVGMAIAGSNDHVYAWYRNGMVSSGTSSDLDQYRAPYAYSLPPGKTPADIVGMGIAGSNDRVYAWYRDGTVSAGSTADLDGQVAPYPYSLPPGKAPADIVEMGIAGSNDHVYAWYDDGTVSSGTSSDLDQYRAPYRYTLPLSKTPQDIVGIGIAGSNDRIYTWYRSFIR